MLKCCWAILAWSKMQRMMEYLQVFNIPKRFKSLKWETWAYEFKLWYSYNANNSRKSTHHLFVKTHQNQIVHLKNTLEAWLQFTRNDFLACLNNHTIYVTYKLNFMYHTYYVKIRCKKPTIIGPLVAFS